MSTLRSKLEKGKFKLFTFTLTFAEVFKSKNCDQPTRLEDEQLMAYFESEHIMPVELDRGVAEKAHELCIEHIPNLKPNDAIHLASALRAGCDVLLTWDEPLLGITRQDVRIEPPRIIEEDAAPPLLLQSTPEQALLPMEGIDDEKGQ